MDDPATNIGTRADSGDDFTFDRGSQSEGEAPRERQNRDVGDRISRYVLQRKLGEGGFGQVWLAHDTLLNRDVAIKIPHRSFEPDSREAKRFRREAEIAAGLTHPNLVPILDADLHEDHPYIVSEYCSGPTLREWLKDRESLPSPRLAISIVAQLADGLAQTHNQGLIHRDIKPLNIILTLAETDNPLPRLTDFGLARAMSDTSDTRMGTLVGSGPYMSPEQASGNTEDHGPHSDVHALGVLLYELLTGHSPFASNNELDTIQRIIGQDPPSIRCLRPEISRDISAVCQKCLEKNPKRRYQDAGELHSDLVNLLSGRPPSARPVGRFGRAHRWASRNRAWAATGVLALASLLTAIAGLIAYAIASERSARRNATQAIELRSALTIAEEQRREADAQRNEALTQRNSAEVNRLKWRHTSYTSDVSLAFLRFNQGYYGDVRRLLDRQVPGPVEEDLRTYEWWLLDTKLRACYDDWGQHESGGNECLFLDDEATLVTAGDDGKLIFWNTLTGDETSRLEGFGDRLNALAVLPEDRLLVSGSDMVWFGRNLSVIDRFTGKALDAFHSHPTTIESIRVSQNGGVIASASRYDSIRCWLADEKRTVTIKNNLRNESFALSPNGSRIATGLRGQDVLAIYDTHTGKRLDEVPVPDTVVNTCSAHQNPWVAFTCYSENGFGIADMNDVNRKLWLDAKSPTGAMAFSADDRFLGVSDDRAGLELFELQSNQTAPPKTSLPTYRSVARVAGEGGVIENLVVSRHGDIHAISYSGSVERFSPMQEVRQGSNREVLDGHRFQRTFNPMRLFLLNNKGKLFELPRSKKMGSDPTGDEDNVAGLETVGAQFFESAGAIRSFRVSNDGSRLAGIDMKERLHINALTTSKDGVRTATLERVIELPRRQATASDLGTIVFSDSGRYVACTTEWKTIVVYDLSLQQDKPIVYRWYENAQSCIAFAPNEETLACGGFGGLEVIDLKSSKTRFMARERTAVRCVSFHPDQDLVLVGTSEGSIVSLDVNSGTVRNTLHGINSQGEQSAHLSALAFYGDNHLVVATGLGEVQFWDLSQRLQFGALKVCQAPVSNIKCIDLAVDPIRRELFIGYLRRQVIQVFRWPTRASDAVLPADYVVQ